MKCTLSILLVLIFTFQSVQSQVTDSLTEKSNQEMYDFYSLKHKKLKKTGFILLGAGLAATGGSLLLVANASLSDDSTWTAGGILFIAGSLSTIASIPVFIVSGSNKRKAKAILGSGNVGIGAIPFNDTRYVSVGVKINF